MTKGRRTARYPFLLEKNNTLPLIMVRLTHTYEKKAWGCIKKPITKSHTCTGIIDTGASRTIIGGNLAQRFNHSFKSSAVKRFSFGAADGTAFHGFEHSFRLQILEYKDLADQDKEKIEEFFDSGIEKQWWCNKPKPKFMVLLGHLTVFFVTLFHLPIGLGRANRWATQNAYVYIGADILKNLDIAFFPKLNYFELSVPCKQQTLKTTKTIPIGKKQEPTKTPKKLAKKQKTMKLKKQGNKKLYY